MKDADSNLISTSSRFPSLMETTGNSKTTVIILSGPIIRVSSAS